LIVRGRTERAASRRRETEREREREREREQSDGGLKKERSNDRDEISRFSLKRIEKIIPTMPLSREIPIKIRHGNLPFPRMSISINLVFR